MSNINDSKRESYGDSSWTIWENVIILEWGAVWTTITTEDEAVDTTCFPVFVTAAAGVLWPKTNTWLTFNSATWALWASNLSGTNTWDETETTILSKMTVFADSKNDTGFFDNTNISVSYDKTARTVTLTRTGWVIYYFQWKKYTLTSPWTSSAHTNAAGNYYLYSTDGTTFSWSLTPWTFDNIMVALAIYDGADGWALREAHWLMDVEAHKSAHNNIGTWRSSGGILTAGTYTENTASDAGNTPWFDLAVVNDADIATTIPAWSQGTYTTMYIGAASAATFSTVATLPFTSAGSYIQVNNAATWALTAGINNRYYNVYQILVPAAADADSQKMRMIMLQPQATFTSLVLAQAEDPRSLSLGNFATAATEFTIYARITYVTSAGDANTGKCRIATWGVSYVIGNRLSSSSLTWSPTNHAWLTNLAWTSSWHTGSNLWVPLFDSTGIATQVVPTAMQSIQVNAAGTAWEAYIPSTIPINEQSAAYTTVLWDAGKCILHPSSDANARTFTIDSNANVAYPVWTVILFKNNTAEAVTIAITSDTLTLDGTWTTGSRTLAQYGKATALKETATTWSIWGVNLT